MDVTVGPNTFRTTRKVHRLVAQAFLPPPPNELYEIDHIDRNRSHNEVSNLRWVTHQENVRSIPHEIGSAARKNGNNGRAKLNNDIVTYIRTLYEKCNKSIADISRLLNLPYSTIFNVVHYKTWVNID